MGIFSPVLIEFYNSLSIYLIKNPNFSASRFSLRWFTPTDEVSLCGHATLATSKVLFDVLGIFEISK